MKTTVRIILLLAAIGILVFLISKCHGCSDGPSIQAITPPDTLYWNNEAGDKVTSLKGTEEAFAVLRKKVADSVARVYKVKLKNMENYLIAWTEAQSDIAPEPSTKETDYMPSPVKDCPAVVKNMRQQFNGPYDSITVQIGDSSYLHKRSYDTVTVVWKKVTEGGIFNRKRFLQVDVSFADTSRHVKGLDAYRQPASKPKRWAIGFQAGVMYNGKARPYGGAGLSYNFIRF